VYKDVETDGSTVLLPDPLMPLHRAVTSYILNRVIEGYGVTEAAISELNPDGVTLVWIQAFMPPKS